MISFYPEYSTRLFNQIYNEVDKFINDYSNIGLPTTITEDNARILYVLLLGRYGNSPVANRDENQFKIKLFSTIWQFGPTWEKRLDIQDRLRKLSEEQLVQGATVDYSNDNSETGTSTAVRNNTRTLNTVNTSHDGGSKSTVSGGAVQSLNTGAVVNNTALNPSELKSSESTGAGTMLTHIDSQTVSIDKDRKNVTTRTQDETTKHEQLADSTLKNTGTVADAGDDSQNNSKTAKGTSKTVNTKALLASYAELWELLDNDVTNDFLSKFKPLFKQFVMPENTILFKEDSDEQY